MKSVAQQYVEQGVQIGRGAGVQRGRGEGVQIGRGEGVRQVARDMLFELQLDLETVKRATKLSQEDLNQIIQRRI